MFFRSRELSRAAIGASVPTQFQVFNVPTELQSLTSSSSQSLINQLVSSGLINQANTTAIAGLIAQLLGQQNSLLSQPFALFGGGITLSALTIPAASFSFSRDLSSIKMLQSMTLRASQGTAAVMKIGERYPVLNSTYAPIYNSTAISQVLGNQSYIAPFPSFNFEDIGFNLKATPDHPSRQFGRHQAGDADSLARGADREWRADHQQPANLTATSAPRMASPSSRPAISPKVSRVRYRAIRLLTSVPGLANRNTQETDDELLVVLTPHVVIANPEAGPLILLPNTMPR